MQQASLWFSYTPLRCITSVYLTRQPNLLTSPELKRVGCYILSQLGAPQRRAWDESEW